MARKYKSRVLAAKIESTYGVDATPAGTDAILTKGLTVNHYEGNKVSRDFDSTQLGNSEQINTGPYSTVTFEVELAGSGTAGDAPGYGALLRACGFSETINAGTDVVYAPVSSAFESVTLYFMEAGELKKIMGARGTVSFSLSKGQLPTMSFTFTGFYSRPAAAAFTPDFSAFVAPVAVTAANTPTYSVLGYTAKAESFSVDMNWEVVYRNVVNGESVEITDRAPSGQFSIEAPEIGTKDFFADAESHTTITTGAVQIVHGINAGNIVQFDAPKVQLSNISSADSDGILMFNMDAQFLNTDGNDDDFTVTVK